MSGKSEAEGSGPGWARLPDEEAQTLRRRWEPLLAVEDEQIPPTGYEARALPFLPEARLVRARYEAPASSAPEASTATGPERPERRDGFGVFALECGERLYELRGSSEPLHEARERERLVLGDATVVAWLEFFCRFCHGDAGPFRVLRGPGDLNVVRPPRGGETVPSEGPLRYDALSPGALAELVAPPAILGHDPTEGWDVRATIQYGDTLGTCRFVVEPDGMVRMDADEVRVTDLPVDRDADRVPSTRSGTRSRSLAERLASLDERAARRRAEREEADAEGLPRNERRVERWVVQSLTEIRLADAVRRGGGDPLLAPLSGIEDPAERLRELSALVARTGPFVVVEAETPFCEEVVADVLAARGPLPRQRQTAATGPTGEAYVDEVKPDRPLLVSLHATRGVQNAEALAYQLLVTDVPVLVGCDDRRLLPPPLRRLVDLVLPLSRMDAGIFRSAFERLLDCPWPEDADEELEPWVRFVTPQDFFQPVRSRVAQRRGGAAAHPLEPGRAWSARLALSHIRRRVLGRLRDVDPGDAPALKEIQGLGEAKVVAQDLIHDIRLAAAGRLSWDEVDRGLLLVGEPGTGKTMLARAMAREAGVRFVARSTASWIAGTDNLGEHLAAMRATFNEARRLAPTLLFLDELDSIGSRKHLRGPNRQYCVEVVNALLQQLAGLEERGLVFVVAATNDEECVDPALRRPGRLDQAVRVPRPTRPALEAILAHYLGPHRRAGRVADDLDLRSLASLALGRTGADVERFVRGAARRARREGTPIAQRHLRAEISGRPRSDTALARLAPDVIARTAVHEAGHAVAALLATADPSAGVTIVSIVPRPNGSLGFTGLSLPPRIPRTRRAYEERLEVLLAGRAAEALAFGETAVSAGAGGSESSDLAVATRLAVHMVCRLGMGERRSLRWRAEPEGDAVAQEVDTLLRAAYARVEEKLARHRDALERLRNLLVEQQEVGPAELAALGLPPSDSEPKLLARPS